MVHCPVSPVTAKESVLVSKSIYYGNVLLVRIIMKPPIKRVLAFQLPYVTLAIDNTSGEEHECINHSLQF